VAALVGGGLLGGLFGREDLQAWVADYRTAIGEQREIILADGTRLWLNTASAINVYFNARERRIQLVTGEIFIATAKDTRRPFQVDTAQGQLRALGT
jgi:transmembrane sensor